MPLVQNHLYSSLLALRHFIVLRHSPRHGAGESFYCTRCLIGFFWDNPHAQEVMHVFRHLHLTLLAGLPLAGWTGKRPPVSLLSTKDVLKMKIFLVLTYDIVTLGDIKKQ